MHDRLVSRRIDALHQCFLVSLFIYFTTCRVLRSKYPISHWGMKLWNYFVACLKSEIRFSVGDNRQ